MLAVVDPTSEGLVEQAKVHGPRVAADSTAAALTAPTPTAPVQDHCCAHHHPVTRHSASHAHPEPGTAPSGRQRQSPHPMVSLAEASERIHAVVDAVGGLGTETRAVDGSLAGHVLAESVRAPHDLPAWQSTNVDGYAIRSSVTGSSGVRLVRPKGTPGPLKDGEVERVNTGGPVPDGADAVVMVEDTRLAETSADGREELKIELLIDGGRINAGDNVRQPGSDLRKDDEVISVGERIGSGGGEIGVLSSVGRRTVLVHRRPKIALLSTGNELVDLAAPASETSAPQGSVAPLGADGSWTGIYDSNRPALKAVAEAMGYEVVDLGIVRDEFVPLATLIYPVKCES